MWWEWHRKTIECSTRHLILSTFVKRTLPEKKKNAQKSQQRVSLITLMTVAFGTQPTHKSFLLKRRHWMRCLTNGRSRWTQITRYCMSNKKKKEGGRNMNSSYHRVNPPFFRCSRSLKYISTIAKRGGNRIIKIFSLQLLLWDASTIKIKNKINVCSMWITVHFIRIERCLL